MTQNQLTLFLSVGVWVRLNGLFVEMAFGRLGWRIKCLPPKSQTSLPTTQLNG